MMRRLKLMVLVAALAAAAVAAPPPVLTLHVVPYVSKPPTIDGKLDDAAWQAVPQITTFYKFLEMSATPTPLRTSFQLAYDDRGLYLAMRLDEKDMTKLKATITQRDDENLWQDDCAEIYVDSTAAAIGFRKFVINALGTKQDLYRMDPANVDNAWSPDGWQAATSKDAQAWYIEAFFPWSDLGKTGRDGDLWRFAICRFSWSSGNLASSAIGAQYAHPECFGWLLFLRQTATDLTALARQLQARVPADWLLPLQNQAIEKRGDQVTVTTTTAVLQGLLRETQAQLADCQQVAAGHAETLKGCEEVGKELAAIPVETADPIVFQQSVETFAKTGRKLEDLKYARLLQGLIDTATK